MIRPLMLVPPLLFAGLVALFLLGMGREDPERLPSALEGRAAPAVRVEPMAGAPMLSDALLTAPGVKLVNFWASWCAPCRAEHPKLMRLAAEGVKVYGVNYKDSPENAARFLAELGNPYAALGADADGRMGLDWGLYGVPETFVIDAAGVVVLRYPGPIGAEALDRVIRPALVGAAAQ